MTVVVEQHGHALVIRMDRPEARNAMTSEMAAGITVALDTAEADPSIRAVILTGTGPSFCAGMDLKRAAVEGQPARDADAPGFGNFTWRFVSKPTIAAVNGFALGGGFEMCLACDLIVAAENAQFGLPEVKRGIIAGADGVHRIARQLPPKVAFDYLFTGRMLDAPTAARWGVVSRLVPEGQALAGALALAEEIAANAPLAVQASKRIAHGAWDDTWSDDVARHRYSSQQRQAIRETADAREGIAAFAEKRSPLWKGE